MLSKAYSARLISSVRVSAYFPPLANGEVSAAVKVTSMENVVASTDDMLHASAELTSTSAGDRRCAFHVCPGRGLQARRVRGVEKKRVERVGEERNQCC